MSRSRRTAASLISATVLMTLAACSGSSGTTTAENGSGSGSITVWAHQGQPGEVTALQNAVKQFNDSGSGVTVTLKLIPEADYPRTIAATAPDQLPDVLEVDGPTVASLVYNGKLSPFAGLVSQKTIDNALDAARAQGTMADGRLYALGQYDSGLALWGNKKELDKAGVKYPTTASQSWTVEQFDAALAALAKTDPNGDGKVLDLQENVGFDKEWGTFGFSPILDSAGAPLLKNGKAAGSLDSPAAVAAMKQYASWRRFTDPDTDAKAFTSGRVALSWVGHWEYPDYSAALGKDLVLIPLPDFGQGTKSGQGSWAWGIGSKSHNGKAAGKFIDSLLTDAAVLQISGANGAPPATKTALSLSPLYRSGGPLQLYADQLKQTCGTQPPTRSCIAVPRPLTAGYPVITQQFGTALAAIYRGDDPAQRLAAAARSIDKDFADNDGYRLAH